jgi:hypothetical protein
MTAPHSKAEYMFTNGNGGWPLNELEFPEVAGWDGACEIAELSGAEVAANPERFIREFLLTDRPAILRDFIRHDSVGRAMRFMIIPVRYGHPAA